jgi:hypothetical protein
MADFHLYQIHSHNQLDFPVPLKRLKIEKGEDYWSWIYSPHFLKIRYSEDRVLHELALKRMYDDEEIFYAMRLRQKNRSAQEGLPSLKGL